MTDESLSRKILKFGLGKLALMGLVFAVFWLIADPLGWIPQSIYDTVTWFKDNFSLMLYSICFLAACYVAVQIINRKKKRSFE